MLIQVLILGFVSVLHYTQLKQWQQAGILFPTINYPVKHQLLHWKPNQYTLQHVFGGKIMRKKPKGLFLPFMNVFIKNMSHHFWKVDQVFNLNIRQLKRLWLGEGKTVIPGWTDKTSCDMWLKPKPWAGHEWSRRLSVERWLNHVWINLVKQERDFLLLLPF